MPEPTSEPTIAKLVERVELLEDTLGGCARLIGHMYGGGMTDEAMREIAELGPAVEMTEEFNEAEGEMLAAAAELRAKAADLEQYARTVRSGIVAVLVKKARSEEVTTS